MDGMNKEILENYIQRVHQMPGGFRFYVRSCPSTPREWELAFAGTCFHEAGHAVTRPLLVVLGDRPIEYITVMQGVEGERYGLGFTKIRRAGQPVTSLAEREALVRFLLSGPVAEHRDGNKVRTALFDRRNDAEWVLAQRQVISGFPQVVKEVEAYVGEHWGRVTRIAEALMQKGMITAEELDNLLI